MRCKSSGLAGLPSSVFCRAARPAGRDCLVSLQFLLEVAGALRLQAVLDAKIQLDAAIQMQHVLLQGGPRLLRLLALSILGLKNGLRLVLDVLDTGWSGR